MTRRASQRFKSPDHAQRFLFVFESVNTHFRPPHHLLNADDHRQAMHERFSTWREVAELGATV
jgi:putative transposase